MVVEETKLRDANRWKEMERNENHPAGQRRVGCIGTKAPNGCESSGAKHNRAKMFLTWYQVNARHPRAESLLKKLEKSSGKYWRNEE